MKILKVFPILLLPLMMTACRTKDADEGEKKDSTKFFEKAPEEVPELASNRLTNEPSDFLRGHAKSSIHWQPWSPQILDFAERSQRLIFVFVGSTTHAQSTTFTKLLESKFADEINKKYVPVLADLEVDPSLALACNHLATERQEPISFPYLLWLSHEGNPIAWLPVSSDDEENLLIGFRRAQNTVQVIHNKSNRYIVENSRYDNKRRETQISAENELNEEDQKLRPEREHLFLSAQNLTDLYDSIDQTFDNTGGIPPGNLITTIARLSEHPASPARFKRSSQTAAKESIQLLAKSAIRDPLDGYFFSRRNSQTFAIPALSKTLNTQAEMLSAITSAPPTPASQIALEQLLDALATSPLQSQAITPGEMNELAYFWSIESLKKILTEEELTVAKAAFNLRGLGNVPNTDDPRRTYFRRNTLGLSRFGAELAEATGKSETEVRELRLSATEKISARRREILESSEALLKESMPTLSSQARLLTALTRLMATSPSQEVKQALDSLGNTILTNNFTPEGTLLRVPSRGGYRAIDALGYDYAVTIEALLEWYRLTWNPDLLEKARSLTTVFLNEFLNEKNYPLEVAVEKHPLTFSIYSQNMIFGPSTWGTVYGPLQKMSALGLDNPKLTGCLEAITPVLEAHLRRSPVTSTDYLLNALNSVEGYLLVVSKSQQDNQTLRDQLAQPKFDSIWTVVENSNFPNIPSPGEKAAVLLKNGEQVAIFQDSNTIVRVLTSALSN